MKADFLNKAILFTLCIFKTARQSTVMKHLKHLQMKTQRTTFYTAFQQFYLHVFLSLLNLVHYYLLPIDYSNYLCQVCSLWYYPVFITTHILARQQDRSYLRIMHLKRFKLPSLKTCLVLKNCCSRGKKCHPFASLLVTIAFPIIAVVRVAQHLLTTLSDSIGFCSTHVQKWSATVYEARTALPGEIFFHISLSALRSNTGRSGMTDKIKGWFFFLKIKSHL